MNSFLRQLLRPAGISYAEWVDVIELQTLMDPEYYAVLAFNELGVPLLQSVTNSVSNRLYGEDEEFEQDTEGQFFNPEEETNRAYYERYWRMLRMRLNEEEAREELRRHAFEREGYDHTEYDYDDFNAGLNDRILGDPYGVDEFTTDTESDYDYKPYDVAAQDNYLRQFEGDEDSDDSDYVPEQNTLDHSFRETRPHRRM